MEKFPIHFMSHFITLLVVEHIFFILNHYIIQPFELYDLGFGDLLNTIYNILGLFPNFNKKLFQCVAPFFKAR